MASVYEAWIKFKGDIQHHWSCDLMKSRISPGYAGNQEKCTCGGWELVAAIESAEAAERERDTYKAQVGALTGALGIAIYDFRRTWCEKEWPCEEYEDGKPCDLKPFCEIYNAALTTPAPCPTCERLRVALEAAREYFATEGKDSNPLYALWSNGDIGNFDTHEISFDRCIEKIEQGRYDEVDSGAGVNDPVIKLYIQINAALRATVARLTEEVERQGKIDKGTDRLFKELFENEKKKREAATTRADQLQAKLIYAEDKIADLIKERNAWQEMWAKAEAARDTLAAQVGALRGALIDKTINTCGLITRGLAKGLGYPERIEGKCEGYTCGPDDDEPHDMCKECIAAYDPEAEYSAALAERGADNE
jgi:hypothetical protein